ncbi:P-loop containing nucleoside triphosphate hydrolase protein [Armillaria gallica]|uniref:P-loop containing nucleoside triphosphate hydrolase protein n=1 Tax=Armillaria gallica TaxID=47427 RepID=A0A2H3DQR5_ARMGA|nr:P-loop containing nucleoside triphosphate hydrolase protein [Armillaria gallica]
MATPILSFGPLANVPDSSQTVMDASVLMDFVIQSKKKWLTDSFIIPLYVVIASAVIFLLQIVFSSRRVRRLFRRFTDAPIAADEEPQLEPEAVFHPAGYFQDLKEHVSQSGGPKIFTYRVLRLVGCLVLLGLSIATLVLDVEENELETSGKWGKKHKKKPRGDRWLKPREWLAASLCLTFLYTFLLAIISVTARKRWSHVAIRHLNAVLVVTTCVYVYRDIAPLATFTNIPRDISEGWVLWAKIAVLLFTGTVIPLSVPREYTPVDPNDPFPIPHPEQTAPLISLFLYFWMDPVVKAAYRVSHLPYDQLPPLADYDANKTLKARSFKYLDVFTGANRRHLFFGLMRVFAWDYVAMVIIMIVQLCAEFAAPIGVNRLLHYLETGGKDTVYRPWLWIVWLFVGPITASITFDWYIFIAYLFFFRLDVSLVAKNSNDSEVTLHSSSPTETEDDHSREETLQGTPPSIKSTDDPTDSPSKPGKDSASSTAEGDARAKNLVGKINNLVTTDLSNIADSRDFMRLLVYVPLQLILCVVFLYVILGWSAFVGLAVIILMFPAPGFLAKLTQDVQAATLKRTDGRVQTVTEIVNVLRMVKLFGWESKMNERISSKREEELVWIRKRQFLNLLSGSINFLIPVATMMATYATYYLLSLQTIIMKEQLSSAKVFSSMAIFDMFSGQLHRMLYTVSQTVVGKVSLDRLTNFMHNTELLDAYSKKTPATAVIPTEIPTNDVIGFCKAAFSWSNDDNGSATPSGRQFLLRIEEELIFHKNSINLVIGPTGSGKTSLLMALLGEMHYLPSGPGSWFNLPREGGVAYAAQESWVLNSTIKENILFGAEFDEQRYKKVVRQCGLERDLTLFDAGDQTEVGEKGLTLSGGQKARVTLARAIYSKADIILLDDVLAALDVHTSKWIIDKCFKGDLIKDRTVILVTHNIAMAEPIAQFIVSLKEGRVASQGSLSTALSRDRALAKEARRDEEAMHKADEEIDTEEDTTGATDKDKKSNGKLIMAEEIQEGHIGWASLKLYLSALGGNHAMLFFIVFLSAYILQEILTTAQTWFLGYWASQYDGDRDPSEVNVFHYIGVYGLLLLVTLLFYIFGYVLFVFGAIRASRTINRKLIESILGTTLRWLDTTPTSRIITRCTGDIRAVDSMVPMFLLAVFELTLAMLIKFIAVVAFTPVFLFPGILVGILGVWCGQIYMKAQLSVKRELSNAKAPVLGHFGAAIAGITSIRAYGAQNAFIRESMLRIDKYTRTGRTFYNLNRWIDVRIDALGGLFSACLAAYLVYFQDIEAFNVGFSLNMAIGVSSMILWWVRCVNQFEVQGKPPPLVWPLERIHGYLGVEQEEKPSKDREPPAYWPTSGELRVENLSARYSPDGPKVLHDLSFTVKSGERIGIVGRTGSGKSSLTLSLLRCIYTEGTVYYDGIPTTAVNLDALRSKITIIPQVPELLSGTLRQNLDPFDQYDDASLNDALRAAGLFSLQNEMEEGRITLDSAIASGGGNLSVGQRQILALARALVRGSKLLILDEDYKTDSIIQSSLRHELGSDMTLITVAHRLQTIMDADKIMVLEAGHIVEFDSPKNLLANPKGKLRSLVDESADKDILYAMAEQPKQS